MAMIAVLSRFICLAVSDAWAGETSLLLPERNAGGLVGRESDEADVDRLDPDALQDELPVDRLTDADVDDLTVSGEGGDRIGGASERADVLVGERRRDRLRRRMDLRHDRTLLACVADARP